MKRLFKIVCVSVLVSMISQPELLAGDAVATAKKKQSFVKYPERTGTYLNRLHATDIYGGKRELSYRDD